MERDGLLVREARRGIWVAPLSLKKVAAGIHVGSVKYGQEMRETGYRFMAYLSDFRMMQWAASNALAAFRSGAPAANAP